MHDYKAVLDEFESCANSYHEAYRSTLGEYNSRAACFSKIAAAYEFCHARLAQEMGVESPWEEFS